MDILDALDEIRSLNARQSKMDPIEILLAKQKEEEEEVFFPFIHSFIHSFIFQLYIY